ncbi:MAG TPA: OmpA family protein [Gaiellaceae bacterium]|nr:OmpA family protein [Gaiellaceae bacterium]
MNGPSGLIIRLQQGAGNASVSRLLHPSPQRALSRFVGPEHEALGNTTGASIDLGNGIVLTWGEIVALAGDEYKSLDDLLADTKDDAGKARLRAALEHDEIPGAIAATLPEPTAAQKSEHEAKYIQLAMHNVEHFPDHGAALGAWGNYHAAAIELAVQAGLSNDPAGMNLAYANEAFGEHFLTDCYSGGHIRTPRTEIVDFYSVFGAHVAEAMVDNIRARLIEALVVEASPQTSVPDSWLRHKISGRVTPGIDNAIATAGGMAKLGEFIGLGIGGAISGAMHDEEGKNGVQVASDDHPETWTAFGDGNLDRSPVSREQATRAIAEAKAQVDEAFVIGASEGATRDTAVAVRDPPAVVHFGFDSDALTGEGLSAADTAAAYMTYRPETVVHIVGHTDPVGTETYNQGLGQRRADSLAAALTSRGVEAGRVHADSMGEGAPITQEPKQYSRNRRAEIGWGSGSSSGGSGSSEPDPQQLATTRAMAKAQARADTGLVLRFVPRPVEEREQASVPGGNTDLPEWRWGSMDHTFRDTVDTWIRAEVGTKLEDALDKVPELDEQTETVPVTGTVIRVHPRDRAKELVRALLANPTEELGNLMGDPPGP